jgi:F-type H+-transporting ATPase subunit alpha
VKGYLTEIPTENIGAYQAKLLSFIRSSYPDVLEGIRNEKDISTKIEERLKHSLLEFNAIFLTK